MLLFWIAAALLSAAAAALVFRRASNAGAAAGASPEAEVYRRQLAELDDLKGRGLLDEAGWRDAYAEAGRRLIAVEDRPEAGETGAPRRDRLAVTAAVGAAVLLGAGLYLAVGSPGRADQPYAQRLKAWRAADPATLAPDQAAAVLEAMAAERPKDPEVWSYLGRAYAAAGQPLPAVQALEKAVSLSPSRADDWVAIGENLAELEDGRIGADSRRAFEQALKADPASARARYFMGQAELADGRREGALGWWRPLAASLDKSDPRRAALERQIRAVESGRADQAEAVAQAAPEDQAAMIRGMVESLAARLERNPDDPQGWARLVRAYTVLGDTAARDRALERARGLFKARPKDLAEIEAAAR